MRPLGRCLKFIVPMMALFAAHSFAADPEELKQRLEQLKKSLEAAPPAEPPEKLEERLQLLKGLMKEEDLSVGERRYLEEKLKVLKEQLPPRKKPFISLEEVPLAPSEKRFSIEGSYWLAYIENADKKVASLFDRTTELPVGSVETSFDPSDAFRVSAGYAHSGNRRSVIRLWHIENGDSLGRSADSSTGIGATEISDWYYENNIKPVYSNPGSGWGPGASGTRGVGRVEADLDIAGTNLDLLYDMTIGKAEDKELGIGLGIKYAQVDSEYTITYSSTTSSPLYDIGADTENTLLGPVVAISGKGRVFGNLWFNGLFDIALTWDHVRAKRYEYDHTSPQTVIDDSEAKDVGVAVVEGELGVRYNLGKGISLGLDYKAAYFNALPFELKTKSASLETELAERNVLFHGLTAGVSYSF